MKLLTNEQIVKVIKRTAQSRRTEIVEFAYQNYLNQGRGFVTLNLRYPQKGGSPWKVDQLYYTTELENRLLTATLPIKTINDIQLIDSLQTYEPECEAVCLIWYESANYVTTLNDLVMVKCTGHVIAPVGHPVGH